MSVIGMNAIQADQFIESELAKYTERLVKRTAEKMQATCPVRTGKLRGSIQANGLDINGKEYGLRVNKMRPFIDRAIKGS